ncbi:MAG: extracellular solute-binding protein, partial [Rhodospirillales bacterium]|nr:extracellular solute-binding protein [Rhodospirillales bacterium]
MIRRRRLLQASAAFAAAPLAAPAIVERANAQSAFDWKQCKGQSIEVNFQLSPRGDLAKNNLKKFEELTGIKVGFEQIPEQQQRPKAAMEMATGHPSFDALNVAMHVQKRLIEKAKWMEDLRPYIADKSLTNPDFDLADFSKPSMEVATGQDGKINVLPLNQDLFIIFYNKELLAAKGFNAPPKTFDEMMSMAKALTDPSKQVYGFVGRGVKNANVVLYDSILLGWDQETVTPDGKKLLTDTPAAIEAGKWYQQIMKQYGPPGNIGFNWNECQTTFMQGRAAMWWDGIGFSAPLLDKTKSKVVDKVGFAPVPAGPKAHNCATFIDGMGIPATA